MALAKDWVLFGAPTYMVVHNHLSMSVLYHTIPISGALTPSSELFCLSISEHPLYGCCPILDLHTKQLLYENSNFVS